MTTLKSLVYDVLDNAKESVTYNQVFDLVINKHATCVATVAATIRRLDSEDGVTISKTIVGGVTRVSMSTDEKMAAEHKKQNWRTLHAWMKSNKQHYSFEEMKVAFKYPCKINTRRVQSMVCMIRQNGGEIETIKRGKYSKYKLVRDISGPKQKEIEVVPVPGPKPSAVNLLFFFGDIEGASNQNKYMIANM